MKTLISGMFVIKIEAEMFEMSTVKYSEIVICNTEH